MSSDLLSDRIDAGELIYRWTGLVLFSHASCSKSWIT